MLRRVLLSVALAWLGIAFSGGTSTRGASILLDGGFELPVIVPNTPFGPYLEDFTGGSTIGPWKVLGNDVLLINTNYSEPANGIARFNAEEGQQSLDLTGLGNTGPSDGVSQSITTVAGQAYRISFYVGTASGGAVYAAPATDDLNVDINILTLPFTNPNMTPGFINWEQFNYDFVSTGATTTITFTNGTPIGTNEAGLDNVSVTALPLPKSALGGIALLGVLAAARFRGQRGELV